MRPISLIGGSQLRLIGILLFVSATLMAEKIPVSVQNLNQTPPQLTEDTLEDFLAANGMQLLTANEADEHAFGKLEKLGNLNTLTPDEILSLAGDYKVLYLTGKVLWAGELLPDTGRTGEDGGDGPTPPVAVAAIPEPASYALLLAQLGVLGFALRRRRR